MISHIQNGVNSVLQNVHTFWDACIRFFFFENSETDVFQVIKSSKKTGIASYVNFQRLAITVKAAYEAIRRS